ncbi:MAG TPA: C4-dicarboxylate TRAP transporter substrate-binding protein [Saccharospirillum sp.]|nr:C4-dicarboxylate TRAP transporter substrate-binding protein [Saccharospirillum sp.]
MRTTRLLATLTLSAATLAFATQAANAENLRLAPGTPPAHPGHTPLYTSFQEQIAEKTNHRMTSTILGTEVVNLGNMRTAVTSGLADAGMFLPAYFPSDLPEINLVGDLSFQGTNSQAMGAAMTEYVVNCSDCQDNLKNLGIVYTSSHASDLYQLLTTVPVSDLDDMEGLRLRAGNPQYARWASALGAAPSNTSVGETFEAISQGILDGTIASTADLISFRLDDVITHITTIRLGTYHSTISHAFGRNSWAQWSEADRKMLAESSSLSSALATQRWAHEMPAEAEALARESGIEFLEPSQELLDATAVFVEEDMAQVVADAESRYGLENVEAKLDEFTRLVKKWTAIANELDNDPQAIADRVNEEVWANVDFSTYGVQ